MTASLTLPDEQLDNSVIATAGQLTYTITVSTENLESLAKGKGLSADEAKAILEWHTATQQRLLHELMGQQGTYLKGSPTKHEVVQAVSVSVIQHKLDEINGKEEKI